MFKQHGFPPVCQINPVTNVDLSVLLRKKEKRRRNEVLLLKPDAQAVANNNNALS